jgi:hypothetical protein
MNRVENMKKKNVDLTGLGKEYSAKLNKISKEAKTEAAGIAGDALQEPVPNFISRVNDNIVKGANNTWIVLGRDRPASRLSGYGGKGDTQAGSIDIVVGRMSYKPQDGVFVDPNFETDSARIYISQKTDVDENFKLAPGTIGSSVGLSAVAMKADSIRIIGRQGIKLVTGVDEENSQGGKITAIQGIELIAGNDSEDIQPLPKGDNLSESMEKLCENIESLSGIISTFLTSQMDFNSTAAIHYHYSPFFGMPCTPSDTLAAKGIEVSMKQLNDCMLGLQAFKMKLNIYKNNYLRIHGEKYINSRFNKVN